MKLLIIVGTRPNTDHPVTVTERTNVFCEFSVDAVSAYIEQIDSGEFKQGTIPKLWDGQATQRTPVH